MKVKGKKEGNKFFIKTKGKASKDEKEKILAKGTEHFYDKQDKKK